MTYSPCAWFEDVFDTMRDYLKFYWPCYILEPGRNSRFWPKHIIGGGRPVLMFQRKDSNEISPYFPDALSTTFNYGIKKLHPWGQAIGPANVWIRYLCPDDGIVLDPYCGLGTFLSACVWLSHNYLAFEICPETAQLARERVKNTQPPLPGLQIEQIPLYKDNEND